MLERLRESASSAPSFADSEEWKPGEEQTTTPYREFQQLLKQAGAFLGIHIA
jgi:hypothetical protein